MTRACNVGPVPVYSCTDLDTALVAYIANTEDRLVFELGSYSEKIKTDHVDFKQLAALNGLLTRSGSEKD